MKKFSIFLSVLTVLCWLILGFCFVCTFSRATWFGEFGLNVYGELTGEYELSLSGFFDKFLELLIFASIVLAIFSIFVVIFVYISLRSENNEEDDIVEASEVVTSEEDSNMKVKKQKAVKDKKVKKLSRKEKIEQVKEETVAAVEATAEVTEKVSDAASDFLANLRKRR